MRRNDIIIMKQHKGRGVLNMDKSKYTEKGLTLLINETVWETILGPYKIKRGKKSDAW